nr:hypothetical protein [Tanacetum cinerariifolium]
MPKAKMLRRHMSYIERPWDMGVFLVNGGMINKQAVFVDPAYKWNVHRIYFPCIHSGVHKKLELLGCYALKD